jgi:hypothetical protein
VNVSPLLPPTALKAPSGLTAQIVTREGGTTWKVLYGRFMHQIHFAAADQQDDVGQENRAESDKADHVEFAPSADQESDGEDPDDESVGDRGNKQHCPVD